MSRNDNREILRGCYQRGSVDAGWRQALKLTGHTALVTGGGSGIGLAVAKALLARGNAVIACGRDAARLESARRDAPGLEVMVCDVAKPDDVRALAESLGDRVSILVNNAGVSQPFDFLSSADPAGDDLSEIDINLTATVRVTRALMPSLRAKAEAAIVNVSSPIALVPLGERPLYCASKAAVNALSPTLREQLKATGIKVFHLVPPMTDTAMMAAAKSDLPTISPERVATALMRAIERNRQDVYVGLAKASYWSSRLMPGLSFRFLNSVLYPATKKA
jgi:uncharacterized oxidoreductase